MWVVYVVGLALIIMQAKLPIPRMVESESLYLSVGIGLAIAGLVGAFLQVRKGWAAAAVAVVALSGITINVNTGSDHLSRQNFTVRSMPEPILFEASRNHLNTRLRESRPGYYAIRDQYRGHDLLLHNRLPFNAPSLRSLGSFRSVTVDGDLEMARKVAADYRNNNASREPVHVYELINGDTLVVWPDDKDSLSARMVAVEDNIIWVFPVEDELSGNPS